MSKNKKKVCQRKNIDLNQNFIGIKKSNFYLFQMCSKIFWHTFDSVMYETQFWKC